MLEFFHIVRKYDDFQASPHEEMSKPRILAAKVVSPQCCPQPLRIQVNLHELCTTS